MSGREDANVVLALLVRGSTNAAFQIAHLLR